MILFDSPVAKSGTIRRLHTGHVSRHVDYIMGETASEQSDDLGLPGWLNDLLKPGVGQGIFMTLKLSLFGLVLTLSVLLCYITDETARLHLSIFLGMSIILLCLVIWFVAELRKAEKEKALEDAKTK